MDGNSCDLFLSFLKKDWTWYWARLMHTAVSAANKWPFFSQLFQWRCGVVLVVMVLLHFCTIYCYWWLIMKKLGWKLHHSPLTLWNPRGRGGVRKSAINSIVLWWLSLLHKFVQLSLKLGSVQVQALLAACWRFEMVRIYLWCPGWK